MSAISEKVQAALYAKLNVSGVTNLATGGVWADIAPESASTPYLLFRRQAPGIVQRTFGPTLALEDDLWLIKAVTTEDDDTTKSPQALGEAILAAAETAIGGSLTLSGNTVVWCERQSDMPGYEEPESDYILYHRGFLLRVKTE